MIQQISYKRNPNIGVFCKANDRFALIPRDSPKNFADAAKKALNTTVYHVNICGTSLIGAMVFMNNKGLLLPRHVFDAETKVFTELDVNVGIVNDKVNALGNLILANDNGGIVSPSLSKKGIKDIEDILDIDVEKRKISGFKTVGSVGVATNKGALIHPLVKEKELEWIESMLKVEVDIGTVNRGTGFVRTGIVANSKGVLVGEETTGPEIMRIEDSLGLLG